MNNLVYGEVIKNYKWNSRLFTLIIKAPVNPFVAGQFTKLALKINGKIVQKAYSYVNSPDNKELEFYLIKIPNGKLTSSLYQLKEGDSILVNKNSSGFFTIEEIPNCKTLWMLSSGTAIGPFLSILQFQKNLVKFKKIILVHAVRYNSDLTYFSLMKKLEKRYKGQLKIQTIVSRENNLHSLKGRIPNLIENGELEQKIKQKINSSTDHFMICGNPEMIKDTQKTLIQKGMKKHLKKKPGNITTEQYW